MRAVLASLVLLALGQPLEAATIRVPADQPTIQAGLDAAAKSDTVLVAPGLYSGPGNRALAFRGKDLVLMSEGGAAVTTIDADRWNGIVFEGGETNAAVVDGFTILDAGGQPGAAFSLLYCSPTIKNCRIRHCDMTSAFFSHPVFLDCIFDHGTSSQEGGALTVKFSSSMRIERCAFIGNQCHSLNKGGAIQVQSGCTAMIIDCLMIGNGGTYGGGAIYVQPGGAVSVVGCTITDNCAWGAGGGLLVDGTASIERSIVAFNHEYSAGSGTGTIVASCTDVFGNEGGDWVDGLAGQLGQAGNVSLDPEFCDRQPPAWECPTLIDHDYGRLSLRATSPCAPEQSGCGLIGALPVECIPVSVEQKSWGEIKATFSRPQPAGY